MPLSEKERTERKGLIDLVTQMFEGEPDAPYGLPHDRAVTQAESFLDAQDPTLGQGPDGQGIRRIEALDEEQILHRARDATTYEP